MRNEETREIKKVLSDVYGSRNVRVVRGRGTAYGWITVTLLVEPDVFGFEKRRDLSNRVRRAIEKQFSGVLSHFYPDDGIGEKTACLQVYVHECVGGFKM